VSNLANAAGAGGGVSGYRSLRGRTPWRQTCKTAGSVTAPAREQALDEAARHSCGKRRYFICDKRLHAAWIWPDTIGNKMKKAIRPMYGITVKTQVVITSPRETPSGRLRRRNWKLIRSANRSQKTKSQ
jgi:hypothetical protein